jgi:hypothetical protein
MNTLMAIIKNNGHKAIPDWSEMTFGLFFFIKINMMIAFKLRYSFYSKFDAQFEFEMKSDIQKNIKTTLGKRQKTGGPSLTEC